MRYDNLFIGLTKTKEGYEFFGMKYKTKPWIWFGVVSTTLLLIYKMIEVVIDSARYADELDFSLILILLIAFPIDYYLYNYKVQRTTQD